ncbi:hypothetical protein ABIE65_001877 [Constrictibacter sp. MBR-5]|jgi:hypothetical protein|uniref:hypothetical protein n=1 Tax=Constrictibacter sp. MBR-5 TaxID=3156467 RepID=UPI00339B4CE5
MLDYDKINTLDDLNAALQERGLPYTASKATKGPDYRIELHDRRTDALAFFAPPGAPWQLVLMLIEAFMFGCWHSALMLRSEVDAVMTRIAQAERSVAALKATQAIDPAAATIN